MSSGWPSTSAETIATNGAHIELSLEMKETFWVALYDGVSLISVWLLLS